MRGFLDELTARSVRGWATENDGQPARVQVWVNGKLSREFTPALPRADLPVACAFDADIGCLLQENDRLELKSARDRAHLPGSPVIAKAGRTATRRDKAVWLASPGMKMLEIGPSYSPLIPRSAGWNSFSLDCATAEELRVKYAHEPRVGNIEDVDFVWRDGRLSEAVPAAEHGTFDYVLACHVFEHAPDPIGFLHSIDCLLKPDGMLSLALPDKRRMFDFFGQISTTSDWLAAIGRTRHPPKTHFDHFGRHVHESGAITWATKALGNLQFIHSLEKAKAAFDRELNSSSVEYVDLHATISTPSSLEVILLEIGQLGLLPFHIAQRFPGPAEFEYWLILQKGAPPKLPEAELNQQRLKLMKRALREQAEAARWLLDED